MTGRIDDAAESSSYQKATAEAITANGSCPHPLVKDMTGERFGRLHVLKWVGTAPNRQAIWLCKCDCGNETSVKGSQLRQGKTSSCGCVKREVWKNSITHGQGGPTRITSLYRTWKGMKSRCTNPNRPDYSRYGGRGIEVCDRWLHSFEAFASDVGEKPGPGYSIDRIDNDGNYEPGNVRWATASEQRRNQRRMQK
ncbi:hypothetical protein MUN77_01505 [Leucobacter allii]|uniref:hypothetical protein n=1 Tax=Leucobacter allii TaxID=2932247 RepID=UPI001FD630B9|nr:hypothetical protein [Leucobacter allii]UOR02035.1 hypothetical protein MUN77_01505 [Leucobacter allii]